MNVSPDGKTVRFKTEPEDLFYSEKSGAKPNTVRIIDHYERQQLKKKIPHKIIIQHQQEIFLRTVTHVYVSEMILGKYIAIFSWTKEKQPIVPAAPDAKAHTTNVNNEIAKPVPEIEEPIDTSYTEIGIPLTLINDLNWNRGKDTIPEFISKLLDYFINRTMHEDLNTEDKHGFVAIGISRQMFNTLQNAFHDRTMNSVVQELYETYLYKHAIERGPLHD